jgi:hypothetical protein
VRERDDSAEQDGVARLAAGADEVAGHDCLPMARRERVSSSPERRDEEREHDDPDAELVARDEGLEAAPPPFRGRSPIDHWR